MTSYESQLLSKLIDVSWEINRAENEVIKSALTEQHRRVERDLIDSMGQDAYDNFMAMGRKMFS